RLFWQQLGSSSLRLAPRHCAGKCGRLRACRSRRCSAIFPPVASPRELLRSIREELGQIFLERDELIDGALVALLAAQHVLVIGPHDRFLLRFVVDYLGEDFRFLKLLQARPPAARTTLPLAALEEARAGAAALPVPGEVLRAMTDLRRELRAKNVVVSDRRWAQ